MITSGNIKLDAIVAELEATVLGFVEGNALKAAEIAALKAEITTLNEALKAANALLEKRKRKPKPLAPQELPQPPAPG
jgi:peptidoglycan hydrolase CwlO-like protein